MQPLKNIILIIGSVAVGVVIILFGLVLLTREPKNIRNHRLKNKNEL